jgi:CheY-like chemotaxis protein
MAPSSAGAGVTRAGRLALAALLLPGFPLLRSQTLLTLEQASTRQAGDYSPVWSGREVTVRGRVSTVAYHFLAYTMLPIQQERGGIVLQVPPADKRLDGYQAGDALEVTGSISQIAGMPVIQPNRITVTATDKAPAPERVPLAELLGFRLLGRLVETEGWVSEVGDTTAGSYMLIGSGGATYKLFLPHSPRGAAASLIGYSVGDKVQATGIALQYCPRPPYNRWFELLLHEPTDIARIERSWFVPPSLIGGAAATLLAVALVVWWRERRLRAQRERLRKIYHLGEEVLGSSSADAMVKRIGGALPGILDVSRVRLYLHNRGAKTLDAVVVDGSEPASIPLASPPGGIHSGAAACFHYRTLLSVPDIFRSPFPLAPEDSASGPKSLLFVPMLAQGEVVGVFELDQDDRAREFTPDEQALAQHLGNQIGVALRLLDQRSVQEQLFRTEKLAAVGRLISGVVNELRAPLASIADLAELAQHKPHACPAEREITGIAAEAKKASGIVARLVSFAAGQVETTPVDVNALIRNLIEFRVSDWKASGIRVHDLTSDDSLCVLGSQGQLEQVFLNLLVHGEQLLVDAPERAISVRTGQLAKRVLIDIGFSAPCAGGPDEAAAAVLAVARTVIAGHGGDVRLVNLSGSDPHFEIDLPLAAREPPQLQPSSAEGAARASRRQITALVIEPDEGIQRQLLTLLAARGYRVVPVNNADTGLELAQRLRFDLALCSVHSPGLNWVELSERMQSRVGVFVLLADGYDPELAADFEGEGRFVLPKPFQETEIERVLASVERAGLAPARTA